MKSILSGATLTTEVEWSATLFRPKAGKKASYFPSNAGVR